MYKIHKRNWVFATNSDYLFAISLQPDGINLWYFELRLFDCTEFIVWYIKGPWHWSTKILRLDNFSLFQKLKSLTNICDFGQNILVILTEIVENFDILRTVLSGKNGHGWVQCLQKILGHWMYFKKVNFPFNAYNSFMVQ